MISSARVITRRKYIFFGKRENFGKFFLFIRPTYNHHFLIQLGQ
jgi:hypothetical protein